MLKKIALTRNSFDEVEGRDSRIDLINTLIDEYNGYGMSHEKIASDGLFVLQKIMYIKQILLSEYKLKPESVNQELMVWHLQQSLRNELIALKNESWSLVSEDDETLLSELFAQKYPYSSMMSNKEWSMKTGSGKGISFFSSSSKPNPEYNEVTCLLSLLNQYLSLGYEKDSPGELLYVAKELKFKLLSMDLSAKEIKDLLKTVNAFINYLLIHTELKEQSLTSNQANIIHFNSWESSGRLVELLKRLVNANSKESFALSMNDSEYSVEFLGGGNNLNWKIYNPLDDSSFVIQIEHAGYGEQIYTNYHFMLHIREDPDFIPFLARMEQYYPTDALSFSEDQNPRYNITFIEYCPRGNLMNDCWQQFKDFDRSQSEDRLEITNFVSNIVCQTAQLVKVFFLKKIAITDIKAENFLIRDDNRVITADLKSFILIVDGFINFKDVKTTREYAPTEWAKEEARFRAEPFMVYQLGLMFFVLLIGLKGEALEKALEMRSEVFIFEDYPIFSDERSCIQRAKLLIKMALSPDINHRPSLNEFISYCIEINPSIVQSEKLPLNEGRKKFEEAKIKFIFGIDHLVTGYKEKSEEQYFSSFRDSKKKASLLEESLEEVKSLVLRDQFDLASVEIDKLKLNLEIQYGKNKRGGDPSTAFSLVEAIEEAMAILRQQHFQLDEKKDLGESSSTLSI